MLRIVALGILLAASIVSGADRPNIVLIFADDLGYGDLAVYGHPTFETPNLDRMAGEGVRFTDFYVPMPFCAPSRAAILTGRYPFRAGVVRNASPDRGVNSVVLPQEQITIAEMLKPLGYATAAIGKWHLGHTRGFLPRTQGFDEYLGILYSNDMRPVQLIRNEEVIEYPVVQATLTQRYTERALGFIEENRDQPFFLYLPHAMPHKPLAASESFYTPETPDDLYADVIHELDWSVGQILRRLEELDLDEKTLVIFTSDNGPWFGGSTAGLRGMKGRPWDGGIRIPMIAWWPETIPAGLVTSEVAGTIDILPTIRELTGAKLPAGHKLDGLDIFPLLTKPGARSPHEYLFAMRGAQMQVVRSGKWKLQVHDPGPSGFVGVTEGWVDPRAPDGVTIIAQYEQARPTQHPGVVTGDDPKPMMLFDLEADPAEQHDVAAAHPDVVKRLKAAFDELNEEAEAMMPPPPANIWPDLRHVKGGSLEYDELVR